MLIRIILRTKEPAALTDEPSVFCRLAGRLPVIGLVERGKAAPDNGSWPDRAWLLELDAEEMSIIRVAAERYGGTEGVDIERLCRQAVFLDEEYFQRAADRFYGRPIQIAQTRRLVIREICPADAEALMQIYRESQIRKYVEPLPDSAEEVRALITAYVRYMYELTGIGIWGLVEKSSGRLIGRAGFEPDSKGEGIALGYLLADFARGQGYAEEACRELLRFAQEELGLTQKEIRCHIAPDNLASRKLAEKLGIEICL